MSGYVLSLQTNIVVQFRQPKKLGKGIGNLHGREMSLVLSGAWNLIFYSKLLSLTYLNLY